MNNHKKYYCNDCFYSRVCSHIRAEAVECKRYLAKNNVYTTPFAEGDQIYVVHNGLAYSTKINGFQFSDGTVQIMTTLGLISRKDVYRTAEELRIARPEMFPRRQARAARETAKKAGNNSAAYAADL